LLLKDFFTYTEASPIPVIIWEGCDQAEGSAWVRGASLKLYDGVWYYEYVVDTQVMVIVEFLQVLHILKLIHPLR
jgi:hypothetical protein